MKWDRDSIMTREERDALKQCPDCEGIGVLFTPSRNEFHRRKTCARCGGKGYVALEATQKPKGDESA